MFGKRSYKKAGVSCQFKTRSLASYSSVNTGVNEHSNTDIGRELFKQYKEDTSEVKENVVIDKKDVTAKTISGEYNIVPPTLDNISSEAEYDLPGRQGSLTPKGTPIKNLPFSPSQVFLFFITLLHDKTFRLCRITSICR